jgi:uncharacterized membrane protein YbhN (UPF0104 family)
MNPAEEIARTDMEKLARMRAVARVSRWSEKAKSPWAWLTFLVAYAGFPILLMFWIAAFNPDSAIELRGAIAATLLATVLVSLLWLARKAQEEKHLRRFYEMELLELRLQREFKGHKP